MLKKTLFFMTLISLSACATESTKVKKKASKRIERINQASTVSSAITASIRNVIAPATPSTPVVEQRIATPSAPARIVTRTQGPLRNPHVRRVLFPDSLACANK